MSKSDSKSAGPSFAANAAAYNRPENKVFYGRLAERLCRLSRRYRARADKVIEIGCGCGYATARIINHYPQAELLALEPISHLIRDARRFIGEEAVFINAAFKDLPTEEKADLIFGNMVYHWLSRAEVSKLSSHLPSGGLAFFTVPLRSPNSQRALSDEYLGNRLLLRAYHATAAGGTGGVEDRWRGLSREKLVRELSLEIVDWREIFIEEQIDARQFGPLLYSRGQLLAVCGKRAVAAARWLSNRAPNLKKTRIKFCWPVALAVLRKN